MMQFLINDDDFPEKYKLIWDKVGANIKEIDGESVYNKGFLKTKIKSNGDEVTDFYDTKVLKVDSSHNIQQ